MGMIGKARGADRMRDWILGLSYGVMLISGMAVAGERLERFERLERSEAVEHLVGEAEIPAEESIWSDCCHHRDCMEAKINVAYLPFDVAQGKARVAIGAYPIFELEAAKIFRSTNGRSYFCRSDLTRPPDKENTRCVFHGAPSYVKR